MNHLAYLVACYYLGTRYHSGQASKGYKLSCLAEMRATQEHTGVSLGRILEHLDSTFYPKYGLFRNEVAFCLKKMRHSRSSL